jgi:hypothetical protein
LFLGIWGGLVALGLMVWTPFRWARWYIPMAPIWAILQSLGLLFGYYLTKATVNEFFQRRT